MLSVKKYSGYDENGAYKVKMAVKIVDSQILSFSFKVLKMEETNGYESVHVVFYHI